MTDKLNDKDLDALIGELQVSTELSRLNHEAIKKVFAQLENTGYSLTKTAKPVKAPESVKAVESKPFVPEPAKPVMPPSPMFGTTSNAHVEGEH